MIKFLSVIAINVFGFAFLSDSFWDSFYSSEEALMFRNAIGFVFVATIFACIVFLSEALPMLSARGFFEDEEKWYDAQDFVLKICRLTPTLLVSIGILGTFYGIYIGLLNFDVEAVGDSVPALLEGLKVAFGTSILGILTSVLSTISMAILISGKIQEKSLRDFTSAMAERIIEALQKVMDGFNAEINDQLGENFKALNEAIGKLIIWQEKYKEQMDAMQQKLQGAIDAVDEARQALDSSAQSLDGSAQSLKSVEEATKTIPEHMEKLAGTVEAFAELNDKAVAVMPMLEDNMSALMQGLTGHVESINMQLTKNLESLGEEFSKQIQEMTQKFNETQNTWARNLRGEVKKILHDMANDLGSMATKTANDYERFLVTLQQLHQQFVDLMDKTKK